MQFLTVQLFCSPLVPRVMKHGISFCYLSNFEYELHYIKIQVLIFFSQLKVGVDSMKKSFIET